ncbi:unnamed protein product [Discula destructiva]
MIPSRGIARVSPSLQSQILSRAPVRSIPRQTISRPRQFGTTLQRNGTPLPRASAIGLLSGLRIGVAGIVSSQSTLLSNRRFASTESTTPAASSAAPVTTASDLSADGFSTFSELDSASILNVPEGIGYLSNLGLDYGRGPTSVCQWVLEHLHYDMGLPWWGAIIGVAVVTRIAMAYPALVAQKTSVKSQQMRKDPVYADISDKFTRAAMSGAVQPAELMQLRLQMKYMQEKNGVGPWWHMVLPMLQIPFAYGMFKLTRAMATLPVPGLENAGTLWFTDLTVADPLYILPCVSSVMMYLSMKRSLPFMNQEQAAMGKIIPWVVGPLSIIITLNFPSSVQLYFAAAAGLQYVQTTLWHIPVVRSLMGLPPLELLNPDFDRKSAAGARRASHFVNNNNNNNNNNSRGSGPTYQAPRTVKTTATEQKSSSSTTTRGERPAEKAEKAAGGAFSIFRQAKEQVMKQAAPMIEKKEIKKRQEDLVKYEKERRQQENAEYLARLQQQRAKRK